jgi:hypothetical protein
MKETVRSLRAYFILVGLITIGQLVGPLQKTESALIGFFFLVGLAVGMMWVVMGVRLPKLLASTPRTVERVVTGSGLFVAIMLLLAMVGRFEPKFMVELILGLLLTRYLVKNVRRLALEHARS